MKINPNCVLRRLGKQNMVVKADGKNSNMSQVYIFNDTATPLEYIERQLFHSGRYGCMPV